MNLTNTTLEAANNFKPCRIWTQEYFVQNIIFSLLSITLNVATLPFVVVMNALIVIAIKTRRRLQTMYNIMLASLAGTDLVVGIMSQPIFGRTRNFSPHRPTVDGILQDLQRNCVGVSLSNHGIVDTISYFKPGTLHSHEILFEIRQHCNLKTLGSSYCMQLVNLFPSGCNQVYQLALFSDYCVLFLLISKFSECLCYHVLSHCSLFCISSSYEANQIRAGFTRGYSKILKRTKSLEDNYHNYCFFIRVVSTRNVFLCCKVFSS